MNEIKVTVTYDKPNTTKFDALMAEYEAAKKCADETVAYYKPLADVAEEAKFDAIMEQLETIKEYAKRISEIKGGTAVWITANFTPHELGAYTSDNFEVVYRPTETTHRWVIQTKHGEFVRKYIQYYCENGRNFIGRWEELKVYQRLEESAYRKLREAINEQTRRANHETNRYHNIVK